MTNTIYFFSSRKAKPSTDNPWLIGECEMEHDDQSVLLLHVNQVDGIIGGVKSKYHSYGDICSLLNYYRALDVLDDDDFDLFSDFCRRIIESFITKARQKADTERSKLKKEIEEDIRLFESTNLIVSSVPFKNVYKLKLNVANLSIYAVDELSGEDYKKVKGKSSDPEDNPLWCDLIVDYLLSKHPDCLSIHLFLHDKDITGFSSDSLTHVGTSSECEAKGLISKHIVQALQNKQLTITFFKHDNPEIVKLIGTNAKIDGIEERLNHFFQERNEYKEQQEKPKKHLI